MHIIFILKLTQVSYIFGYLQNDWSPDLHQKKNLQLMMDIHNHLLVFYILNEYELNNSD